MPGEDERPPGDPALEAARLDAVAGRLETLGMALQRSIGETTESTATLSRTVGTVSADLGRLIGEAVTALGQTRKIVLATDDSVGGLAQTFEQIEQRIAALGEELAETVERQRRLEEDRPGPEELGAAVGTEVSAALVAATEGLSAQLDLVVTELRDERAVLAAHMRELTAQADHTEPALSSADVRAEVEAVVGPWISELRDELAQLVTEVHEDRAVLSRRLAGAREVEELRELVEALPVRDDVVELRDLVVGAAGRADLEEVAEELAGRVEAAIDAARPDEGSYERLRTDLLALADDLATTAKRAAAGQRAVEELRARVEKDLPTAIQKAVAETGGAVTRDTEALMGELHDDLSLVMRQVVSGNEELEALRETVAELAARGPAGAEAAEVPDLAGELGPVVRSARDDVMGAVGDLHEDLALVLKRLAAGQRELDDMREAILGADAAPTGPTVDPDDLAARVQEAVVPSLAELGDDLSVLVRSVSGTQEELEAIRASVSEVAEALAAATAESTVDDEEEVADVEEGPDLAVLLDGLRSDIDAGIGAAVSDLRDELDSVRRLVGEQPEPLAAAEVRTEVDALLADVREDLALLAQQLANGQDDVAALRGELAETLTGPGTDHAGAGEEAALAAAEAVADQLRTEVGGLAEEIRSQFDRLRQVLARSRPEPPPDLSGLGGEVAAEVAGTVEPVVAGLHEDLAGLAAQLEDARAALEQLQASSEVPAPDTAAEVGATVEAVIADLHDDLALVLGQVVAAQQEVQALREEVAVGQEDARSVLEAVVAAAPVEDVRPLLEAVMAAQDDLRAALDAVLVGQDDVRAAVGGAAGIDPDDLRSLLDAVTAGQDEVRAVRDGVSALLEGGPSRPSAELEALEVAVADLPAVMAAELRAELEVVADDLRAGLSRLQALGTGGGDAGTEVAAFRAEVQALMQDLQSDLGTVIREIVAGHDEVSQLRGEVANVADAVDAVAPVEDPAVAIEGMRADVTAGLAELAAELRSDVEALVAELHEDLAAVMSQVVAGHDDLDALRQQLAEVAASPGATDQVAEDLDRLTRDLQALRDRIPGGPPGAATPPARRRPRAHPGR